MHPALKKLDTADPEERQQAAETLLQRYQRKQLHGNDTVLVLNELLTIACAEDDADVQATLIEAIDNALVHFPGDHAAEIHWQVLVDALPQLEVEALALALPMLSLSGRADAKAVLASYLSHRHAGVQEAASFALDELEMNAL